MTDCSWPRLFCCATSTLSRQLPGTRAFCVTTIKSSRRGRPSSCLRCSVHSQIAPLSQHHPFKHLFFSLSSLIQGCVQVSVVSFLGPVPCRLPLSGHCHFGIVQTGLAGLGCNLSGSFCVIRFRVDHVGRNITELMCVFSVHHPPFTTTPTHILKQINCKFTQCVYFAPTHWFLYFRGAKQLV